MSGALVMVICSASQKVRRMWIRLPAHALAGLAPKQTYACSQPVLVVTGW